MPIFPIHPSVGGGDFRNAKLQGARFDRIDAVNGIEFGAADLHASSFKGAKLGTSKFDQAILQGADFSGANLTGASFHSVEFDGVRFDGADLSGTVLKNTQWNHEKLINADFRGANLKGAAFRHAMLRGAKFGIKPRRDYGSKFANGAATDLRGADLSDSDLTDAQFGVVLVDCHTKLPAGYSFDRMQVLPLWGQCSGEQAKTGLRAAHISSVKPLLSEIDGRESRFSGMELPGIIIRNSQFDGSDFSHADLHGFQTTVGRFDDARFEYANLADAEFSSASFKRASLVGADLRNSRMIDTDFSDADLRQAILTGVCFDESTRWPLGFDPIRAGALPRTSQHCIRR